jgi:regulator of sigma E protease
VGDKIVAVGDTPVLTYQEMLKQISLQGSNPVDVRVEREGQEIVLEDVTFPTRTGEDGTTAVVDFDVEHVDILMTNKIAGFSEGALSHLGNGLMGGDEIVKVGGVSVHTYDELSYEIMNQGYEPISLTVIRDGVEAELEGVVFPTRVEKGTTFGTIDFIVWGERDPSLGALLKTAWFRSVSLVKMVWDSVINLATGRYSVEAVASPIGVTAAVKDTITDSGMSGGEIAYFVLNITAVISINLGVFNLIPFPALDGGRLFFLVIEGIIRRPVSREVEAKIHFIGIVLLMMLMVLVVGKDLLALIFP